MTPQRMTSEGVEVRLPNALDAAAGQQPQWNPHGLAIGTEYVDRTIRVEAVEEALHYVAPVGQKRLYVEQAMAAVRPFLSETVATAAA